MPRKTLHTDEAKRIGSLGGKSAWSNITPAERSKRMKALRAKGKQRDNAK